MIVIASVRSYYKLSKPSLCDLISIYINISLETGTFPSNMKIAKIIPIYKSIDKSENSRPITLLPQISKLRTYCMKINMVFDILTQSPNYLPSLESNLITFAVFLDLSGIWRNRSQYLVEISYIFMVFAMLRWWNV